MELRKLSPLMGTLVDTGQGSYLQSVAYSMALLAYHDKGFRESLGRYLFDKRILIPASQIDNVDALSHDDVLFLMPISRSIAEEKLAWLVNELEYVDIVERNRIQNILSLVAVNEYTFPQAASWGVIDNETLGVYVAGHPFRRSGLGYSQVVILERSCSQLENFALAKLIHSVSVAALNRCVEDANYDFKRLEPEVIEWLSGPRDLELYWAAADSEFEEALTKVRMAEIKFALVDEGESGSILALQPSATGTHFECVNQLTPVE